MADEEEVVKMDVDQETKNEAVEQPLVQGNATDGVEDHTPNDEAEKGASNDRSSSESEEEEAAPVEPLATTRVRRANAGNRMSTLLLEEEEDAFYTSQYGGFAEEEDDGDFDSDEDQEEDDYDVDSDFSIDETDEIADEHKVVEEESTKKKGVYKDPKPRGQVTTVLADAASSTPIQSRPRPSSSSTPLSPSKHRAERSFRDSTRKKTAETIKNIETGKRRKKKRRNFEPHRTLTQEERLEEAKTTEEENIKSLEIYQRLESDRLKKIKLIKKTLPVPYVTYYSSVFTNPETKERYSRNLCMYVGCDHPAKSSKIPITSKR